MAIGACTAIRDISRVHEISKGRASVLSLFFIRKTENIAVTKRDRLSQPVTGCHTVSQPVTPSLA